MFTVLNKTHTRITAWSANTARRGRTGHWLSLGQTGPPGCGLIFLILCFLPKKAKNSSFLLKNKFYCIFISDLFLLNPWPAICDTSKITLTDFYFSYFAGFISSTFSLLNKNFPIATDPNSHSWDELQSLEPPLNPKDDGGGAGSKFFLRTENCNYICRKPSCFSINPLLLSVCNTR